MEIEYGRLKDNMVKSSGERLYFIVIEYDHLNESLPDWYEKIPDDNVPDEIKTSNSSFAKINISKLKGGFILRQNCQDKIIFFQEGVRTEKLPDGNVKVFFKEIGQERFIYGNAWRDERTKEGSIFDIVEELINKRNSELTNTISNRKNDCYNNERRKIDV